MKLSIVWFQTQNILLKASTHKLVVIDYEVRARIILNARMKSKLRSQRLKVCYRQIQLKKNFLWEKLFLLSVNSVYFDSCQNIHVRSFDVMIALKSTWQMKGLFNKIYRLKKPWRQKINKLWKTKLIQNQWINSYNKIFLHKFWFIKNFRKNFQVLK
jgi:hypothetical protein